MKFNSNIKNKTDFNNLIDNIINYNNDILSDLFVALPVNIYFHVDKKMTEFNTNLKEFKKDMSILKYNTVKKLYDNILENVKHYSNDQDVLNVFKFYGEYFESLKDFVYYNNKEEEVSDDDEEETDTMGPEPFDGEDEERTEDQYEYVDDTHSDVINNFTTKKDLREMSYKDVFNENKLISKNKLINYRNTLVKQSTEIEKLNKIQQTILRRRISISYVIEEYYNFIDNLCKEYNITKSFKLNGDLPFEFMKFLKYKVKASESEDLKYTHDNGIIYFWVFKDAIIFKTI